MKKILLVDDSALMRRVLCDIINSDNRFTVADEAINGEVALKLLKEKSYDAVVLDVNMPKMDGIELLKEIRKCNIKARVLMASTVTIEGAKITMDALELGALDFIHKPDWAYRCKDEEFVDQFVSTLDAVCSAKYPEFVNSIKTLETARESSKTVETIVRRNSSKITGNRIVALACSS